MIPAVLKIEENESGTYILPWNFITISGNIMEAYMQVFLARLNRISTYKLVQISIVDKGANIDFITNKNLLEEEYCITINRDGIIVETSSFHGLSNALTTLFLKIFEDKGKLKFAKISDQPLYAYRGFMLDVSRHFFPIDEVKKLIEQCALLKLNKFHWHLSDDQGFRIESKVFPQINEIGSKRKETNGVIYSGYYSQKEIRDVVKYAQDRFIDVIPEIDIPGHTTAMIASYPELSCSKEKIEVANSAGIYSSILCPGKESTYSFLYQLLDEICNLFPYEYFHIGGDEAPKSEWKKCPDCQEVMKENDFNNYEQLQALFTMKIIAYLKTKGKKVICWNDAVASTSLDQEVVVQYWAEFGLKKGYTWKEVDKNRQFILSNYSYFYCDQSYAQIPLQATYQFSPFLRNVKKLPSENIFGIEAPLWTEYLVDGKDIEKMCFPRLLAVAERGWSNKRNYPEFMKRVLIYLDVLKAFDVEYTPYQDASLHGLKRINTLITNIEKVLGERIGDGEITPHVPDSCTNDQEHNIIKMAIELYGVGFNKFEILILLLKLSKMQQKIKSKVKL